MIKLVVFLFVGLAVVTGLPQNPIIRKLSPGPRYQYAQDAEGQPRLVDLWETLGDLAEAARYNPDTQNVYHLFTRKNPSTSQPLVPGNLPILWNSNYNAAHKTVVLLHGWGFDALGGFISVAVPAFLASADCNVIVVDWTAGTGTLNYPVAVRNTVTSGEGVARFINWLDGASLGPLRAPYHIVGFSLGGQQAGIVGRNLARSPAYVTGLDPAAPGWNSNEHKLKATDGVYTEAIHTNAGGAGYLRPTADVDFYPNGGITMPGCLGVSCHHSRCFYYFAESLQSGGFTGRRCENYQAALVGNCTLPETLNMGGIEPKTGKSGVYFLETNSAPPFSRG